MNRFNKQRLKNMDILRSHNNKPTASFDVLHNDKRRCHTKRFYEALLVKLLLSSAGIHNPTE